MYSEQQTPNNGKTWYRYPHSRQEEARERLRNAYERDAKREKSSLVLTKKIHRETSSDEPATLPLPITEFPQKVLSEKPSETNNTSSRIDALTVAAMGILCAGLFVLSELSNTRIIDATSWKIGENFSASDILNNPLFRIGSAALGTASEITAVGLHMRKRRNN